MEGKKSVRFNKPRLIAAFMSSSSYWIPPPLFSMVREGEEFQFKLYLKDEFGNKWVSENGGLATNLKKEDTLQNKIFIETYGWPLA